MKKIFTLVAAAVLALTVSAKDYTDDLAITLNGVPTAPAQAKITVNPVAGSDGLYDIVLNQFTFAGAFIIGDVTIEDVKGNSTDGMDGYTYFEPITKEAAITNAEGSSIAQQLGFKVTVTIKEGSKMSDNDLYLLIELPVDYGEYHFDVVAVFGTGGYQIKNSGFEYFHKATYTSGRNEYSSDEPNAWHSFMSSTGSLAGAVRITTNTFISDDVRPNSLGTSSVRVVSSVAMPGSLNIPANGTMTTGQMQAGAFSATDSKNCAFLDFENEEVDGNGDPFYTVLNGKPDALTVWVKFKQGQDLGENKYASVNAVITDGTRYQDPEDPKVTYNNVVAKAQNKTIESKDFAWQQLTIPFDYDTYALNEAEVKAILVTITTNAQPGVGSSDVNSPDEIYVDDIALVYNAGLESLTIKGSKVTLEEGKTAYELDGLTGELTLDDIAAVSDGRGAMITKSIEYVEGGALVTVTVTSNDYQTVNTWTINVKDVSTGIDKVETTTENDVQAIYTIDGRQVNTMDAKGIYIVRKADGTTVKVLKK